MNPEDLPANGLRAKPNQERGAGTETGRAARSRHRIFDAAETLFAAKGYSATRVQQITDRADINKRMLYHYFGNKRGLYDAVVQHNFTEILGQTVDAGSRALAAEGPLVALAVVVREYFDALHTHPRYVRFMQWEEADRWSVMNALPHLALDQVRELLVSILRQGMDQDLFDRNLDPAAAWSYIVGVPGFYFNYRPRLQLYSDEDLADPLLVVRFRNEVVRFALLGMGTARERVDEVMAEVAAAGERPVTWLSAPRGLRSIPSPPANDRTPTAQGQASSRIAAAPGPLSR